MIELDESHPHFSLDMEILCSIPCELPGAAIRDIADDFGLEQQVQVTPILNKLKESFSIRTGNVSTRRAVWVPWYGWRAVCEAGQAYWDRMNENKD